jgi:hypothetical protein
VDAYLTAVEATEERELAETTAKAVASVAGARGATADEAREASAAGRAAAAMPAVPVTPTTAEPESETKDMFQAVEGRWGSRQVEITEVTLLDGKGQPSFVFHSSDPLSVQLKIVAHVDATDFVFGVSLFNAEGVCCYGTNTFIEQMDPETLTGESTVTFSIDSLELVEGTYKLDVAVHTCEGAPYDYHRLLYTFRVKSRIPDVGIYRPRHHWTFSPNVRFKNGGSGS